MHNKYATRTRRPSITKAKSFARPAKVLYTKVFPQKPLGKAIFLGRVGKTRSMLISRLLRDRFSYFFSIFLCSRMQKFNAISSRFIYKKVNCPSDARNTDNFIQNACFFLYKNIILFIESYIFKRIGVFFF